MTAIVQEGSGSADALRLREIDTPAVTDDSVVVRVHAASVNALDWHTVHAGRLLRPIDLLLRLSTDAVRGVDLAGEVEAVGRNCTRLRPGDRVFGTGRGTFAEYAASSEDRLAPMPRNVSFSEAAAVGIAAITALQGLRDVGQVKPGQRVAIYGAGGGVGTFAVQIAKALGAHVTAVTGTDNLDVVRALGPDEIVDRTREDFTRRGTRYDVILDVAADRPLSDYRPALTTTGRLVIAGAAKNGLLSIVSRVVVAMLRSRFGGRWLAIYIAKARQEDLLTLKELIEAGKVRPVIDRQYALDDVAEAVRYVGSGRARAKVVINVR